MTDEQNLRLAAAIADLARAERDCARLTAALVAVRDFRDLWIAQGLAAAADRDIVAGVIYSRGSDLNAPLEAVNDLLPPSENVPAGTVAVREIWDGEHYGSHRTEVKTPDGWRAIDSDPESDAGRYNAGSLRIIGGAFGEPSS